MSDHNQQAGQGAMAGLLGAAALGMVAPLCGRTAGLISAPFSPGLLALQGNPLVIGPIQASGSFREADSGRAASLLRLDPPSLGLIIVPALTLSVLLSIDTLKTCVGLDALTRSRHNSNRELIGQGCFFGELAFLDRGIRSADVGVKVATDLYVLSRSRFNEQARADAAMGVQLFARLASAIAERLRQTDAELQVLEER